MLPAVVLVALLVSDFDYRHAVDDRDVLSMLQDLASRGASKPDDCEVAAFIVRERSGALRCLTWPERAVPRLERYVGAIPAGTVAIAHTHPLSANRPSPGDVEQSMKTGLPIFVVSRWNVYVVDPATGYGVALIKDRNWTRVRIATCRCEQPARKRGIPEK